MSCLTVGQHKAATVGSIILHSYNRKHRLVFDQPNKQNPGLYTPTHTSPVLLARAKQCKCANAFCLKEGCFPIRAVSLQ